MSTVSVLDNEKALEMDNGAGDFSGELYQTFRDNTKAIQTSKKQRRQTYLNLFPGISFTPTLPKPDKERKKQINKNYKPIPLVNTDEKVFIKYQEIKSTI